jgi:hypothetical protein
VSVQAAFQVRVPPFCENLIAIENCVNLFAAQSCAPIRIDAASQPALSYIPHTCHPLSHSAL